MVKDFKSYAQQYKDTLLKNVVPFWSQYSPDEKYGGFFTCLDRNGMVYDTDKFVKLQAQQVYAYSMLYNLAEQKEEWLNLAEQGARFLQKYGQDKEGNWYFSVDRQGNPIMQPYDLLTDFYVAMAFSEYAKARDDDEARAIAVSTYDNILQRRNNPLGKYNRLHTKARTLKNFEIPKVLCNLTLEMEFILEPSLMNRYIDICLHEVLELFLDKDKMVIYENILSDGSRPDHMDGRLINPGNGIEAMWFAMEIGYRRNDQFLIDQAVQILLSTLEYGWDQEHGGLFLWMDDQGFPLQQHNWNHKLWWPHLEALISLTRGYVLTRNQACLPWIQKVHEYTWQHFPDAEYGEWFGYLGRNGDIQSYQKGGVEKSFFHMPRALFKCWRNFEEMATIYYD